MLATRNILSAFVLMIISTTVQAQSFSCAAARMLDEIAICGSKELSALDFRMAHDFSLSKLFVADQYRGRLVNEQRAWLKSRSECGKDVNCIRSSYKRRLGELAQRKFPLKSTAEIESGLPNAVGQCVETTILTISDRFGNDVRIDPNDRSGTRVNFSNGGGQVSYAVESSIDRSKVGDKVRMCLVSLPKNCPAGDDRGRVYNTRNLRTGEAWTLSDSQHECGGA